MTTLTYETLGTSDVNLLSIDMNIVKNTASQKVSGAIVYNTQNNWVTGICSLSTNTCQ
jgi:hypothetical protein